MGSLFAGKRVLVTGSTRGIGRATARRFLEESADVLVHGRTAADRAAQELARDFGSPVAAFSADLGRRGDIAHLAAAAGYLDVLVNCAGIYEELSIADAGEDHWDRTMAVNLDAPWLLSRAFMEGLAARKGVIVNVASDSGLMGYARSAAYCASKGALIGLTRAMATELAPSVRVICVCPGPVDTDMMRNTPGSESWETAPLLRRFAQPVEIAEAILFAASPRCSFQTGSVITIDGGTTAGKRT